MKSDAAKLWLFARYPVAAAAADMADYSGKSGNFMFAQIAIAIVLLGVYFINVPTNKCMCFGVSVSMYLCKYINDWH